MAEVLGLAASALTVIELFAKIGVLCSIYCTGVKAAPREIRSILNEADRCTASLRAVERLVARPKGIKEETAKNLYRTLEACRQLLDQLAAKLEHGTKFGRLQWPLDKKGVLDVVKRLEQCRTSISLDLQVTQTDLLLDANQESVLSKLRTVAGATYDAHNDVESTTCYPNTRVEILQQIQDWGTSPDGECIFWLNGMAGTGKSTISRTVAQAFSGKKMLGASFFFKRGEGDRGRAALFIPTIAAQLIQQLPSLAQPIYEQMCLEPDVSDKSIIIQFQKLIERPAQLLPKCSAPPILVVVVDALDECDRLDNIKLITHLLSQARHFQNVRLKFFLTSRPELPILMGFQDLESRYETLILHEVPEPIIENDIRLFLEIQLSKIRSDYNKSVTSNRRLPPDWPGGSHEKKLVDLATPLFIFAATVCRFIQDRRFGSPRRLLARFLENQKDVGSRLQATYGPVLDQILLGLSDAEKHELGERFREIVGSIVALASPLTTSSLSSLLGVPQDAIEDQLDLLHSVLQVPHTPDIPIRLLHLSFRDFLFSLDNAKEGQASLFSIAEDKTHERLATRCLDLLSKKLKTDMCNLQQPGTPRASIHQDDLDTKLSSEVQYACRYWAEHWRLSGSKVCDGDVVHRFLTCHLLHWLEVLSLLGLLRESVGLVDDLLGLLKSNECSSSIRAFLLDTRRVVLGNMSTLDEYPLQLYYSAIAFAPTGSIVRKIFLHALPPWLLEPPETEEDWGPCVQTLQGTFNLIWAVAFSPNSKMLAIATNNDTVELLDPSIGLCIATLYGQDGYVLGVNFSSDSVMLAATSEDNIVIWDTEIYEVIATLKGHTGDVTDVEFKPNSKILASASCDETIKIWDLSTSACIATLEGHEDIVQKVSFSPDSKMLASASSDLTVKLWDMATNTCTATLEGHTASVQSVAFSPDSTRLVSSSADDTIRIWNPSSKTCVATLEGHDDSVESVAFSSNAEMLASASLDETVKLWDLATGTCISTLEGHLDSVQGVAFSPDGRTLASASRDGTVKIWDTEVRVVSSSPSPVFRVRSVPLSPDGNQIACVTNTSNIGVRDLTTGSTKVISQDFSGSPVSVLFSPDSALLLIDPRDGTAQVWDMTADPSCITSIRNEEFAPWHKRFSDDSQMLAFVSKQLKVRIFRSTTGEVIKTVENQIDPLLEGSSGPGALALSGDFSLFASAPEDGAIKLWATDGAWTKVLSCDGETSALAFSLDSSMLASGLLDAIKLWNIESGTCVKTIPVPGQMVQLVFDASPFSLSADFGTIMLDGDLSPQTCSVYPGGIPIDDTPVFVKTHGLGLSQWNEWITWGTRKLFRLPTEYISARRAVKGSTIAMKLPSEHLILIRVSPNDSAYD